jgi:hypothetical protein
MGGEEKREKRRGRGNREEGRGKREVVERVLFPLLSSQLFSPNTGA